MQRPKRLTDCVDTSRRESARVIAVDRLRECRVDRFGTQDKPVVVNGEKMRDGNAAVEVTERSQLRRKCVNARRVRGELLQEQPLSTTNLNEERPTSARLANRPASAGHRCIRTQVKARDVTEYIRRN